MDVLSGVFSCPDGLLASVLNRQETRAGTVAWLGGRLTWSGLAPRATRHGSLSSVWYPAAFPREPAPGRCSLAVTQRPRETTVTDAKITLPENEIPTHFYNIVPDLPTPMPPPLHPVTREPIGPEALAPIFPASLIAQEVSQEG